MTDKADKLVVNEGIERRGPDRPKDVPAGEVVALRRNTGEQAEKIPRMIHPDLLPTAEQIGGSFSMFVYAQDPDKKAAAREHAEGDEPVCTHLLRTVNHHITTYTKLGAKFKAGIAGSTKTRIATHMGQLENADIYAPLLEYVNQAHEALRTFFEMLCSQGFEAFIDPVNLQFHEVGNEKIKWIMETLSRAYPEIGGRMANGDAEFKSFSSRRNESPEKTSMEGLDMSAHIMYAAVFRQLIKNITDFQDPHEHSNPENRTRFMQNLETMLHNMSAHVGMPFGAVQPHVNGHAPTSLRHLMRVSILLAEQLNLLTILKYHLECK
ncbi:hypothetical protein KBD59_01640 [Candidatus Gracilibacteria bacterium]|nr:hypothetical protein [Candidatus Gracilibacteria bacterium]